MRPSVNLLFATLRIAFAMTISTHDSPATRQPVAIETEPGIEQTGYFSFLKIHASKTCHTYAHREQATVDKHD